MRKAMKRTSQHGATLIEVLVTVLVLAIGLLSVAALQGIALNSGQQAYQRSQATALVAEMADWMRAHRSQISQTGGVVPALTTYWQPLAAQRLPAGTIAVDQIVIDNTGRIEARISVTWTDDRAADAQPVEEIRVRSRF